MLVVPVETPQAEVLWLSQILKVERSKVQVPVTRRKRSVATVVRDWKQKILSWILFSEGYAILKRWVFFLRITVFKVDIFYCFFVACITGTLWAHWGESGILRGVRPTRIARRGEESKIKRLLPIVVAVPTFITSKHERHYPKTVIARFCTFQAFLWDKMAVKQSLFFSRCC